MYHLDVLCLKSIKFLFSKKKGLMAPGPYVGDKVTVKLTAKELLPSLEAGEIKKKSFIQLLVYFELLFFYNVFVSRPP